MANAIVKYTSGSSFTNKILHLEGREVFGSTKQKVNITPGLEGDLDRVNFFRLRVNTTLSGFVGSNVDVGESSGIVRDEPFVLTFQGFKVQEHVCRDSVWRIERCPPLSNTRCFVIQKDSMKHYDTRIIAKKIVHGIPSPYYNGLWSNLKRSAQIHHKFWFCVNNLTHCVGRIGRKYHVDRPLVPSTWPMQVGTNLIQFEMIALGEARFILCEACKCVFRTLFVNENTTHCK